MKIKLRLFLAAVLCSCLLAAAPERAGAQTSNTLVFDITGLIDTTDLLIIHGDTLQWHHPGAGAAVGRHSGANQPTTISTTLDGGPVLTDVAWIPTWPQPPPNEIRFEAYSSLFTGFTPAMPDGGILSVSASTVAGRGSVTITQTPTQANDYTLIAQFTDGFNGAASLHGQITVTTVPEPTTALLLAAGLALPAFARRRRRPAIGA
jgi:hypothetical protein